MSKPICFIENQLYLLVGKGSSKQSSLIKSANSQKTDSVYYLSVDTKFEYQPFFEDFGPLHLAHVYFFCKLVDLKLKELSKSNISLFIVTSHDGKKLANAAWLMCAYMVVRRNHSPEEAFDYVKDMYPSFIPFRDPAQSVSTFDLTVLDCLRGLAKGIEFGFFDYDTFNGEEYLFYEQVDNGDLNWIVPGKCIACAGPHSKRIGSDGYTHFTPDDYIDMFKRWGVTAVVRLNKKMYDAHRFTQNGINHYDLYFVDGGIPSETIIKKFLKAWETEQCLVVHCKAGLGRTGTCIGCALMKYYQMTALETIAWLRIARPGSVIGIQQHFLQEIQEKMWRQGQKWRQKQYNPDETIAMFRLRDLGNGNTRKFLFSKRRITPTYSTSTQQKSAYESNVPSHENRSSTNRPQATRNERSPSRSGISLSRTIGPMTTVGIYGNIPGDSRLTPFSHTLPSRSLSRSGTSHGMSNRGLNRSMPISGRRMLSPLQPLKLRSNINRNLTMSLGKH